MNRIRTINNSGQGRGMAAFAVCSVFLLLGAAAGGFRLICRQYCSFMAGKCKRLRRVSGGKPYCRRRCAYPWKLLYRFFAAAGAFCCGRLCLRLCYDCGNAAERRLERCIYALRLVYCDCSARIYCALCLRHARLGCKLQAACGGGKTGGGSP